MAKLGAARKSTDKRKSGRGNNVVSTAVKGFRPAPGVKAVPNAHGPRHRHHKATQIVGFHDRRTGHTGSAPRAK